MSPSEGVNVSFLATTKLFGELDQEDLAIVARQLLPKTFDPGDLIVREGEAGDECYLIRSGQAAVVARDLIGQEATIAMLGPGDTIGEVSLVNNSPRTASVRAVGAVAAVSMPREVLDRLRDSFPRMGQRLAQQVHRLAIRSYLKSSSPFAELSGDALWDLATKMRSLEIAKGTSVVREGEAGNRLFLIQSGRFTVTLHGVRQRELESGDCFGEVALLTGGPRTTTVTALTDARALVLDKPDFDAVVSNHPAVAARFAELRRIRHAASPGPWVALPDPVSTLMPFLTARRRRSYLRFLGGGAAATIVLLTLAVAQLSGLLMLLGLAVGSLLGPVAYVMYIVESQMLASRRRTLLHVFVLGGFLAPAVALLLEAPLLGILDPLHISVGQALWIGISEEFAKGLAVLWFLRRREYRFEMDGLIFGAAAGMGFAAIESLNYSLSFLAKGGAALSMQALVVRGLLSPFGHGTWSAILGAAIWKANKSGTSHSGFGVATAFATVVLLHALWDVALGDPALHLAQWVVVGVAGLLILRMAFRRSLREQAFSLLALDPRLGETKPTQQGLPCRVCSQLSVPGAHYCVRCGATLKRPQVREIASIAGALA